MTVSPDELINALGAQAERLGWSLEHIERGPAGIGLVFVENTSPYGAQSSVHRARQKIAVITDIAVQNARRAVDYQRTLRDKPEGFSGDEHI